MMEKKRYLKPIITLVLIVPFLTELLSGNLPPSIFFQPYIFLTTIIVYGLVALIIRELAIKWKLGIEGIFILGIAYGIYNEGICAKTLLMSENVPLETAFGEYNLLFGINFAWAVMIVVWHSLHAVVYPILIVTFLYPYANKRSWLNRKWSIFLTALIVGMGIFMFFTTQRFQAPFIYLPAFAVTIALLAFLSKLVPKTLPLDLSIKDISLKPAILGFCFCSYAVGLSILASKKVPIVFLYIYAVLIIFIFYKILKAKKWLLLQALTLFAFGNYMADALFLFLAGAIKGSRENLITSFLFVSVFTFAILKIVGKLFHPPQIKGVV